MGVPIGVTHYEFGTLALCVSFPNGERACKHCWLCQKDPRMPLRQICASTMEILWDVNRLGARCPLEFEGSGDEQNGQT